MPPLVAPGPSAHAGMDLAQCSRGFGLGLYYLAGSIQV
jgi:hypothetical protein